VKKVLFIFVLLLSGALLYSGNYLVKSIEPEISKAIEMVGDVSVRNVEDTTIFYDSDSNKIAEFKGDRRYNVDISTLSDSTLRAFLAIEDSDFYTHGGVSITGILRAAWENVKARRTVQGASTITQQVARTFFLTREKTIERKLREMMFAVILEKKFSKKEILELYLNKIYFGNGAYGIEAAAQTYFRKKSSELDVHEAALLAALPKAPSKLNPIKNKKLALGRQKIVLRRMYEEGFLTISEYQKYRKKMITVFKTRPKKILNAPYYVSAAVESLRKYVDQKNLKSGLRVYTSLSLEAQKNLESSLKRGDNYLTNKYTGSKEKYQNESSYAGVTFDVKTGEVIALVGGKDYRKSEYNRALYTKRQMGDLIIPVLSVLNLEMGEKLFNIAQRPNVSFYDLLKNKGLYELASISSKYGFGSTYKILRQTGIKVKRNDMGLMLGQEKLSLFQLAHLYSSFSSQGRKSTRYNFVDKVLGGTGREIVSFNYKRLGKRAFSKESADVVNAALKSGKCKRSYISASGKTDDYYAVEFNDRYLTAMWFGSEKGKVMLPKLSNSDERAFYSKITSLDKLPCNLSKPKNISYYRTGSNESKKWIPFISGNETKKF
jgi:membrane peptidoglycan carboxypeptidase